MIFENVSNLRFHLETDQDIDIGGISRENPQPSPNGKLTIREYSINCHEGLVALMATGFKMIVRQLPVLHDSTILTLEERGGISFSREAINP